MSIPFAAHLHFYNGIQKQFLQNSSVPFLLGEIEKRVSGENVSPCRCS